MSITRVITKNLTSLCVRDTFCAFVLPSRNTYIVKRKHEPPYSRQNARLPRFLKPKHFIYETVEDTDLQEQPDLKIVLTTFVEGVGDVGDVITLIPHYARDHFLLPQKAVYATPENIEKYANMRKTRPESARFSSVHAGMTMRTLSRSVIPVFMNSKQPWAIDKKHMHYAFWKEEFVVPEECIELPSSLIEGPDPTLEGKDFAVFVTINNREKFPVRCRLFHIKPGFETDKLPDEYYLDKNDPILEEQKDILEEMPNPEILNDPSQSVSIVEKFGIKFVS